MGGDRAWLRGRRGRSATIPLAASLALTGGAAAGCESPVPFYRPGHGSPDDPVVGLGGPAPYLPRPSGRDADPAPLPGAAGGAVYAATGPGMIAPTARDLPARLYLANGRHIVVIEPRTLRIVRRVGAGRSTARVVPSWDLRRLWAADAAHGTLVPVGPLSGRAGRPLRVADPAALYFTPDGHDALVLSTRTRSLDVRDPRTMLPRASIPLPCAARYADFTLDGASVVASCAAAGRLVRVDVPHRRVTATLRLPDGAHPADLRLSPDGGAFFVADAARGGIWLVDARRLARPGFVRTATGARGLAVSRDARRLFVVGGGTLAAVDFATRRVTARWRLPGGGSAVPGGVSSDGTALWLATPTGTVCAVSTRDGRVLRKLHVGGRPAGLTVHPQPGRHSLGGTGLYR